MHTVLVSGKDSLRLVLTAAGRYSGSGVNHVGEAFTADLELQQLTGNNAALLQYVATRSDGKHLHAETALVSCDEHGDICLWPAMEEMPNLLVHRMVAQERASDESTRLVFASGPRDDRTAFREEVAIEIRNKRIVGYRHSWGLPGGDFDERSWCRFTEPADTTPPTDPKYSKLEIERRWLVPGGLPELAVNAPVRLIEDRYILGTHLRLRATTEAGQDPIYKLGKKYPSDRPLAGGARSVVSVYLTHEEYAALCGLPTHQSAKRRYAFSGGSIDVYAAPRQGLTLFEVEFPSLEAAGAFVPPQFVGEEVSGVDDYSGFSLALPEGTGQ